MQELLMNKKNIPMFQFDSLRFYLDLIIDICKSFNHKL